MSQKPKIYISYAWQDANEQGESREKIVDEIKVAVDSVGYHLIRDKEGGVGFGLKITKFMQEIGKGDLVIIVVSNKYLKSKNCMYEIVQIMDNNNFPKKTVLVVLPDANIYDSASRSEYHEYWLDERRKVAELAEGNAQESYLEELDLCSKVITILDAFMVRTADTNTLTVKLLRGSNFLPIISKIHNVFDEFNDEEIEKVAKFLASESINNIHPDDIEQIYKILESYKEGRRFSDFANYLWLIVYFEYSKPLRPIIRLENQVKKRISQVSRYKLITKEKELVASFSLTRKVAKSIWETT